MQKRLLFRRMQKKGMLSKTAEEKNQNCQRQRRRQRTTRIVVSRLAVVLSRMPHTKARGRSCWCSGFEPIGKFHTNLDTMASMIDDDATLGRSRFYCRTLTPRNPETVRTHVNTHKTWEIEKQQQQTDPPTNTKVPKDRTRRRQPHHSDTTDIILIVAVRFKTTSV